MNASPQAVFTVPALGLIGLIAVAGLLLFSGIIVATVLVASRHSLIAWQKLKAALAVLVWIVPAGAVVVYIARHATPRFEPAVVHQEVVVQSTSGDAEKVASSDLVVSSVSNLLEPALVHPANPIAPAAIAAPDSPLPAEAVSPRLVVRGISSDEPKWLKETLLVGGRTAAVFSSKRYATLAEAEDDLTRDVLARVKAELGGSYPLPGDWDPPVDLIDRLAVKDITGEVMDRDFKNGTKGKMYRAHARLDLSPQFQSELQVSWRGRIVEHRLMGLGGVLGLVTLMLGTAAGYFRLDDLTGGTYRRRLKLAAAAIIAAGGLVAAQVVA